MRALVLCFLCLSPSVAQGAQVHYAIVVGNNAPPKSAPQLSTLRYADDDAVRFHQLFSGFAHTSLLAVLDAQTQRRYPQLAQRAELPTLKALERVLGRYRQRMEADLRAGDQPVLYFAFSGHGALDQQGEAFLSFLDGPLDQASLHARVLSQPARYTHLLIDACRAGSVVGLRGETKVVTVDPTVAARAFAHRPLPPHVGALVATTERQEAHEWARFEAGVFTHELLSGLLGAADVNGDLKVEYSELQAFIASANRDISDPRAHPQVLARAPSRNVHASLIELQRLSGAAVLKGDPGSLGRFYIELESGQRYLDAHLARGTRTWLALPAGVRAFLRTKRGEAQLKAGAGARSLSELRLRPPQRAARGSIDESLSAGLFRLAYGRSYYQGFVDSQRLSSVSFGAELVRAPLELDAPSRAGAITMTALAAVSAAAAATTGALAWDAQRSFEGARLRAPAEAASARYEVFFPVALTSSALTLVFSGLAWWLWS